MTKRILIADDDQDLVQYLAMRSREVGLEVDTAYDSPTAVARINEQEYDLVCLDVSMPGGNALNVSEMMTTEPKWSSIPIVILTGSEDPETIMRCHRLCAYYVLKGSNIWQRIEPLFRDLLGVRAVSQQDRVNTTAFNI